MMRWLLTFQSNEVTSLLLGTSWPPSRMQCLKTSWVELLLLFSLRFHIRAVESPDLMEETQALSYDMNASAMKPNHHWVHSHRLHRQRKMTNPDANRSLTGFQAQMKTSDSWPLRTMALFWGISTSPSTSIRSEWLSKQGECFTLLLIPSIFIS